MPMMMQSELVMTDGHLPLSWYMQVSFLLLGVENIGVQIEQPFSVLPLELFCAIIRANVMEQLQAG